VGGGGKLRERVLRVARVAARRSLGRIHTSRVVVYARNDDHKNSKICSPSTVVWK
jgi:protein subunit release factor A